jgi:hypothetical protein
MFKKGKPNKKPPYSEIANIVASVPTSVDFLVSLRSDSRGENGDGDISHTSRPKSYKDCKRTDCLSLDQVEHKYLDERNAIVRATGTVQDELKDLAESQEELRVTLANTREEGVILKNTKESKERDFGKTKDRLLAVNEEKRQLEMEVWLTLSAAVACCIPSAKLTKVSLIALPSSFLW